MKSLNRSLLLFVLVAVAGCQTMRGTHQESGGQLPPASVPLPPAGPGEQPEPLQPQPVVPQAQTNYPQSAAEISGPAVSSLLRKAQAQRAAGEFPQAAAPLGRALRIEPRNYFVWSALASTYLDQKDYGQAENIAMKSNSLARGNVYVDVQNWAIIRDARAAAGNVDGAAQAQAQVEACQQQLLQIAPPQDQATPVPPGAPPPN